MKNTLCEARCALLKQSYPYFEMTGFQGQRDIRAQVVRRLLTSTGTSLKAAADLQDAAMSVAVL